MADFENFFNTHTHHFNAKTSGIVQLNEAPNSYFSTFFSLGIHPQNTGSDIHKFVEMINAQIHNPKFIAIGEIGLDNRFPDMDRQEEIYIEQLRMANELKKPVILHCVNSWDRCRFLHQEYAPETTLIYHGFNKASILGQVMSYPKSTISIGTSVLTNIQLQNVVKTIPVSRLFVETDDSEIAIEEVYQKLAEIKSLNLRDFSEQIRENVKRIFGI